MNTKKTQKKEKILGLLMIITKNISLLEKKVQNFEANFCLDIQMLQWGSK